MTNKCIATRTDGSECNSPAGVSGYCFSHDPARKDEATQARLRGGLNRRVTTTIGDYPGKIANVQQLLEFVNRALEEAWNLPEGSEKRLRAVTSLLRVACEVIPLADLDARLQLLESLLYGSDKATKQN